MGMAMLRIDVLVRRLRTVRRSNFRTGAVLGSAVP
jgi:hypothetical protein